MTDDTQQSRTIGRYLVLDEIGRGGMGVVYRGFDPAIGRPVALKMLILPRDDEESRELKQRLYREAGAAGGLAHPNIVTIYDVVEQGPAIAVAMELVQGVTLQSVIAERGPLPMEEALGVLEQVCAALDFASQRGIVHRDIKPANIHVTPAGTIKVMDFGVARLERSEMTRAGTVLGSPRYMSPEQVRGLPLDGRSDLFSAAVVFYEMITRERPFAGSDIATTMYRIVHEPPTPVWQVNPGVSQQLDAVLEKALAKDREGRYPTGAALVAALRRAYARAQGEESTVVLAPSEAPAREPAGGVAAEPSVTVALPVAPAIGTAPAVPQTGGRTVATAIRAEATRPIVRAAEVQPVAAPPATGVPAEAAPVDTAPAGIDGEAGAATTPEPPAPAATVQPAEPPSTAVSLADTQSATAPAPAGEQPAGTAVPAPVEAAAASVALEDARVATVGETPPEQPAAAPAAVPAAGAVAPAPAAKAKPSARPGRRRFRLVAVAAVVVVGLAVAGGAWWALGRRSAPEPTGGQADQGPATVTGAPSPLAAQSPAAVADQTAPLPPAIRSNLPAGEPPHPAAGPGAPRAASAEGRGKKPSPAPGAPHPANGKPAPAAPVPQEPPPPAAPEPARQVAIPAKAYEITDVDVKPVVIRQVPAAYPEEARSRGLQDVIVIRVLVTENGEVADARIARRAQKEPAFEPAALAAVRQWSFKPAEKRGKPVACWLSVGVAFSPPRLP